MSLETTPVDRLGSIFADAALYADPDRWHAAAARIRSESPILRVELDEFPRFFAITKHADVMLVERHPEVFASTPVPTLAPKTNADAAAVPPVKTLVQMDGAEHKQHRGIVNDWFKPGNVKNLQTRVDELAIEAVEKMETMGGRCDFVNDIALEFPLQVILAILGLPESDYARMLKLTQELFGAEDPDIGRLAEDEGVSAVIVDFVSYFSELAAARRACPTGDLASVIANAEIDNCPLADTDVLGHYLIIATAGHDTTSNAISGGLMALLEHRDQLELLQREPQLMDGAFADEIIRYVTPVKHFLRHCQERFTVGDTTFEPGDVLYLSFASANRDEEVFADPMRLDVRRPNASSHVGFGFGRHFCLGAHLARMEIRSLFKALIPRLEHIELAGEATWIKAYFVEGPKSIPIEYRLR